MAQTKPHKSWSANELKVWEKCAKKYEYQYVRRLDWPSNPKNFRLGKGVHQLLDYQARNLPIDSILETADSDIKSHWQVLANSYWATLPILGSEWPFSLEVEGHWLYGRIDRIVQDGDLIRILDWKTGTGIPFPADTDWQTRLYLYAVHQSQHRLGFSIAHTQLAMTYVQVKDNTIKDMSVDYSETMAEQIYAGLLNTIRQIETAETYNLPESCPDKYCPYRTICGISTIEIADDLTTEQLLVEALHLEEELPF